MDLRQVTHKNDPRPTIRLPAVMLKQLEEAAKKEKRSLADEVIRRIGKTFKKLFEAEYRVVACELKPTLENTVFDAKHNKQISSEMMAALQDAAKYEGHSLDMEVALRLGVTLEKPEVFEASDLLSKILGTRRTKAFDDAATQDYQIRASIYYERERLKHFMYSMDILPKTFTEIFQYIDVEAEAEDILKEMHWEDRQNRASHDPIIKRDWNAMKKRIQVIAFDNKSHSEQANPSKPDGIRTKGAINNAHDNKKI